jgi:hypothetical protein
MTRLRRRPRAVYRVYGEDEYLAGVDALPAGEGSPSDEPTHGRRLQRIAGAAALTGAVGTVGGVVGLAGLRVHAGDRRELAARTVPSIRAAASRGHASAPAHVARRQILHPSSPRRMHGRRSTAVGVSRGPMSRADTFARAIAVDAPQSAPAHRSEIDEISDRPSSAVQGTSTEAVSAVQGPPPAAPEARPRAQSEFGFER